jgi:hypothetical protein
MAEKYANGQLASALSSSFAVALARIGPLSCSHAGIFKFFVAIDVIEIYGL